MTLLSHFFLSRSTIPPACRSRFAKWKTLIVLSDSKTIPLFQYPSPADGKMVETPTRAVVPAGCLPLTGHSRTTALDRLLFPFPGFFDGIGGTKRSSIRAGHSLLAEFLGGPISAYLFPDIPPSRCLFQAFLAALPIPPQSLPSRVTVVQSHPTRSYFFLLTPPSSSLPARARFLSGVMFLTNSARR